MAFTGLTTRPGECAICNKSFPKGTLVYFDSTKSQGKHLAHKECFDKIILTRGLKKKKTGAVEKSTEELDPPF